jgi:hypothetical protein
VKKEKLLIIFSVSLFLIALGILGLTYSSKTKAADSFTENWTVTQYRNYKGANLSLGPAVWQVVSTMGSSQYNITYTADGWNDGGFAANNSGFSYINDSSATVINTTGTFENSPTYYAPSLSSRKTLEGLYGGFLASGGSYTHFFSYPKHWTVTGTPVTP